MRTPEVVELETHMREHRLIGQAPGALEHAAFMAVMKRADLDVRYTAQGVFAVLIDNVLHRVDEALAQIQEVALLRARCAYVLAHGSAWEQRVMRGELDHEALGTPPAPTPPGPAPSPNG